MDKFYDFINFFSNITQSQIVDILIALLIIILFKILSGVFACFIVRILKFVIKGKETFQRHWAYKPSKVFFVFWGFYIGLYTLKLPSDIFFTITKAFKICLIILISNALVNLFNNSSDFFEGLRKKFNFKGNEIASNFLSKIIASLIYIIMGFIVISEFGYDLGGLVTGLGISSVVIAFATQDLIKSLFSGFSIIYDKTFEIGDYIQTNDFSGTVEDITLKTTRIRDLNNQIIVIPNYLLTDSYVINSSKIKTRQFSSKLTLELNTPTLKINSLIISLKTILEKNENIILDTVTVFLDTVSNNGINISINCYSYIDSLTLFLPLKEQLNYEILELLEKLGIRLACPCQTIYLKKDI